MDPMNRRAFMGGAAGVAAAMGINNNRALAQQDDDTPRPIEAHSERWRALRDKQLPLGEPGRHYAPVTVPNGQTVPFKIVDGVKVFHLTASEITHAFAPGLKATCWGYNGLVNATTLEAVEGDTVRVYVTNKLPVPTTVHWHGFILPQGMDGVSGLQQPPIPPGETWVYQWKIVQHGTFMFHSHHDTMTQEGMGLTGLFIVHPRDPKAERIAKVDRDFALMLHEWRIDAGASRPNVNEMTDFNVLTINGKVMPHTAPLVCATGQRVRLRLANLSAMDHHPIHLHGHEFFEVARDGGRIPPEQQRRMVTALMGVGQTRDLEFIADNPGDWPMHCHMTHHVMSQMGHVFPNMVGVDAEGYDEKARRLLPGYMTMGTKGMSGMGAMQQGDHSGHGDHGDHGGMMKMKLPPNSIPMQKGKGPHGPIGLGGMATVIKIRDGLTSYEDPGWYKIPEGTAVRQASAEELKRDGVGL